jgi:hypothetical protein
LAARFARELPVALSKAQDQAGTQRRQERRTGRTERREERRTGGEQK